LLDRVNGVLVVTVWLKWVSEYKTGRVLAAFFPKTQHPFYFRELQFLTTPFLV